MRRCRAVQPFRDHAVHSIVGVLDWDHRLPSKQLTLRLHVLYDDAARARFDQALTRRREEIVARDLFPEFDVPDFAGLPADEAYDVELTAGLDIEAMRLTSPWRRDVAEDDAAAAIEPVRTLDACSPTSRSRRSAARPRSAISKRWRGRRRASRARSAGRSTSGG